MSTESTGGVESFAAADWSSSLLPSSPMLQVTSVYQDIGSGLMIFRTWCWVPWGVPAVDG